jgi:hypothetical protein
LDINGPKIGLPNANVNFDTKLTPPPKEIPTIEIKNPSINVSLDKPDSSVSGQGSFLPSLRNIIDSQGGDIEFAPNVELKGKPVPDSKASASLSVKVEATEPSISISAGDKKGTALLNNLISADDKKNINVKVSKEGKKGEVLKAGKPKVDINISGGLKVEAPKLKGSLNITASGKTKPKIKSSHTKVKEVQLPAKIIKMKDLISQQFKDPIHDVKEIPRFEVYRPKNK